MMDQILFNFKAHIPSVYTANFSRIQILKKTNGSMKLFLFKIVSDLFKTAILIPGRDITWDLCVSRSVYMPRGETICRKNNFTTQAKLTQLKLIFDMKMEFHTTYQSTAKLTSRSVISISIDENTTADKSRTVSKIWI